MLASQHMLDHCGSERRSVLVGSSVHNRRMERLWRDMHRCVTGMHHNLLNPINEIHLYALHYVFLPRINRALRKNFLIPSECSSEFSIGKAE